MTKKKATSVPAEQEMLSSDEDERGDAMDIEDNDVRCVPYFVSVKHEVRGEEGEEICIADLLTPTRVTPTSFMRYELPSDISFVSGN